MQFYCTYTYLSLDYECLYIFGCRTKYRDVQKYVKGTEYPLRYLQWLRQISRENREEELRANFFR